MCDTWKEPHWVSSHKSKDKMKKYWNNFFDFAFRLVNTEPLEMVGLKKIFSKTCLFLHKVSWIWVGTPDIDPP